jgi:hypothetical protein
VTEGSGYLAFVWSPSGYRLSEREGEPPAPGTEVELDGEKLRVTKLATSPLPGDTRPCVYLHA